MYRKLSQDMKKALISIIEGNPVNIKQSTFKSLYLRGLITDSHQVTCCGWQMGISFLNLEKQCKYLDIELETLVVYFASAPELATLKYYENQGYIGTNAEGGAILNILKALILEKLAKYNFFNDRNDACCRYLEAQLTILKEKIPELISEIKMISKDKFLNNFSEIISTSFISSLYPELSMKFADAFYNAMNINHIMTIAAKFAEEPYRYRAGWPDLILIRDREIQFVEVKTTDKLHISQIDTISVMKSLVPYKFKVVRLKKYEKASVVRLK